MVRRLSSGHAIVAAGAVVWRHGDTGIEICLIHRPKYDDWTLPKGKVDPDEHVLACAVREVEEETGYAVALGPALPHQRYLVAGQPKVVYYWAAHAEGGRGPWLPTDEVDAATFAPLAEALDRLSYPRDAAVVAALPADPVPTTPLVLLRHAKAVPRDEWRGPDSLRPLSAEGAADARRLDPPLGALGITQVVSSDAARCIDTVEPYAAARNIPIVPEPAFSENGHTTGRGRIPALVQKLLAAGEPTVICSHRPVLPDLLQAATDAADVAMPAGPLPSGAFHILHHRDGTVIAVETHNIRRHHHQR